MIRSTTPRPPSAFSIFIAAAIFACALGLSGCIPLAITGVVATAQVATDRRTTGAQLDDELIEDKSSVQVLERFKGNDVHVNVTSYNGNVLLTGEVPFESVRTEIGDIALDTPRDRAGSFEPRLVPKGVRRAGGLDEMIVSLYAGGMTVRDIQHHLARTLGTELSHETISNITDAVLEEVKAWQTRPLEELYPIIYLDALIVKVRDGHQVRNKAAHLAVGVDLDGIKHVLGIWVQTSEGAKFWAGVCAELRNRGIRDVLIVCCDGLSGFPEAIEATWPAATVQTCTVHLIRAAMRFVSYQDRKRVAAALRPIYTAPTVDAAESELLAFAESDLGRRYPATVATWENAWERFSPFLAFPPELRRIIYTTNSIESLNYQLRKIIKNRGHFPNDDAVIKLLWLAIRDIEDKRARARAKEKGAPREQRKAPGRLVEGAVVHGWKQALGALALAYPERLAPYLG